MSNPPTPTQIVFFTSQLGWMGVVWAGQTVRGLTFGHDGPFAVALALEKHLGIPLQLDQIIPPKKGEILVWNPPAVGNHPGRMSPWESELIHRLQAYAEGKIVDFTDVPVDPGTVSLFQARVYALCRQIPYGRTITYGQLARQAGAPRAARAVGQCLARNPIPILIPCHRVVGAGGKLVGFTAPGGLRMKKRLLQLEAIGCQHGEPFRKPH
jgi:methylated-DNA-[protein]-cysteine S-methyltransferase